MGETIPPTPPPWPPDLDDDKAYHVTLDCYQDPEWDPLCFVGDRCVGDVKSTEMCSQSGAAINAWYNNDLECVSCTELCPFTGYSAQKLMSVSGPYD